MTRLNLLLLVVLIGSCIHLIQVAHESRRLFAELDRARKDERQLVHDLERLESDKQSQATPLRVERTARDKLKMTTATPAVTQYVTLPPAADLAPETGLRLVRQSASPAHGGAR